MCLTANNLGLKEENINISKPLIRKMESPLIRKTGWVPQKERETDGQKEGVRMQCFMKLEDTSLIDVENVDTSGERCCHLS